MYIEPSELKTAAYDHVIEQITNGDDSMIRTAIDAAVEEIQSYLSLRYDTEKIFSATGSARNPMVVEAVKDVTVWNLIRVSNAELLYDLWKSRYDRVIDYFTKVSRGTIAPALPLLTSPSGSVSIHPKFGSNRKFRHE